MQLVVVSEVAMAVRMVMTKCRILLQSSFLFMVGVWFWGLVYFREKGGGSVPLGG